MASDGGNWIRCENGFLVNLSLMDSIWVTKWGSAGVHVMVGHSVGDQAQEFSVATFSYDATLADDAAYRASLKAAYEEAGALRDKIAARLGAWDPMSGADTEGATR